MNNYSKNATIQKSLKNLNCLAPLVPPPVLQVNFKTTLNACIFGLKFLNGLTIQAEAPFVLSPGCATELQPKIS